MRTIVRVITWTFCLSLILFSPILLALMGQYVSNQKKDQTPTLAWAYETVQAQHLQSSPRTRNSQIGPQGEMAPSSQKDHQSLHVGDVHKKSEVYLVMDLSSNRLLVKRGEQTLYRAVASAGSGKVLNDPRNPARSWVFETPRGTFGIQSKLIDPVWIQPDWAFIEAGQPVPRDHASRLRTGVLGKYALGFGNGYFIHGALYTHLLGTNFTHGCIQLGDEDLHYIFQHIPLGANLIIVS